MKCEISAMTSTGHIDYFEASQPTCNPKTGMNLTSLEETLIVPIKLICWIEEVNLEESNSVWKKYPENVTFKHL